MYPPQKSGSAPSPGPPGPAPPAGPYQSVPRRHPDFEKTQPPGKILSGSGVYNIVYIFFIFYLSVQLSIIADKWMVVMHIVFYLGLECLGFILGFVLIFSKLLVGALFYFLFYLYMNY